ncbi:hypothetical protein HMPREF9423_0818 [Streptococcus infantis ATCC 700779]|uniref:Uncharacterized protein n=1 Tax=Streptococcus infantis ATCC 700779 TaxID=889204 RepID=E8K005_9STRE|nr:hypothetical protein HMPREF9423_0818 [Streptococcus infantis ATCC 700779]
MFFLFLDDFSFLEKIFKNKIPTSYIILHKQKKRPNQMALTLVSV